MKEPVLPEGIVNLDRSGKVPLAEQIYRGYRAAVRSGLYPSETKLPSSRRLAAMLGVGRNTANTAYDLLQAEGIVTLRPGSAPRIAEGIAPEGAELAPDEKPSRPALSRRGALMTANLRGRGPDDTHLAFQPGAPALDCFPYEEWARCLRRAARSERSADLIYRNFTGLPELRQYLSGHLAIERGVRADPEQIIITSSMQASLFLLAQTLSDPGDVAWLEEPGYLGARTAFHAAGLTIRQLATDGEGADAGRTDLRSTPSQLIYVTPSHHFPLGARMPLSRRLALLDAARSAGAIVLEDDYDSEFLFSGRPVAALYGLAEEGQVIYLSTFSKSLMPGLRIAYCVVPRALVAPMREAVRNTGCAANVQAQTALAHFMDSGAYRKHLKQIRAVYQERGNLLVDTLQRHLGNRIEVEPPTGNVQVAMKFRERVNDVAFAAAMQANGFSVSPLSGYFLGPDRMSGLVIGFAGAAQEQIAHGVRKMGDLLEAEFGL